MSDIKLESEIESSVNQDLIAYSMLWEDHLVLEKALDIQKTDKVLSIASAGCNVLNLLLKEPAEIVAIDFNPSQLHLLHLKIAGIKALEHDDFLVLLGFREGDPLSQFYKLEGCLSPDSYKWWEKHSSLLESKISHQGKLEKYFQGLHRLLISHISPENLEKLRKAESLKQQNLIFQDFFDDELRKKVQIYFEVDQKKSARDSEKFKYVEDQNLGPELWNRFEKSMTHSTIAENFYNEYILFSNFLCPQNTYPYLYQNNFMLLKSLVNRITVVHGSIESYLQNISGAEFDKANLSDIFEYMSADCSIELLRLMSDRMKSGGRIAYWNLYNDRSSSNLVPNLRINEKLSSDLHKQDRTWFYRRFILESRI